MEHPITPPPELIEQWRTTPEYVKNSSKAMLVSMTISKLQEIATQAARWGADQELEACREWTADHISVPKSAELCAARRPKPPSLKQQALESLDKVVECFKILVPGASVDGIYIKTIRCALECLPDLQG